MKTAQLIVAGGPAKPGDYRIALPTVIGRGRKASLMIPHPLISRLHCKLYFEKGNLLLRDLGSLNGTYVNNRRIDRETILSQGDVITIGDIRLTAQFGAESNKPVTTVHDTEQLNLPSHATQRIHETTVATIELISDETDLSPEFSDRDGRTVGVEMTAYPDAN